MSYGGGYRGGDDRGYGGARVDRREDSGGSRYSGGGGGGGGGYRGTSRPGDWKCECGFNNYANREECRECRAPKSGGGGGGGGGGGRRSRSPPSRRYSRSPPRRGAGGEDRYGAPRGGGGPGGPGFNRGDNWDCPNPKCGFSNFAKRYKCLKCEEARTDGGGSGGGFGGYGGDRGGYRGGREREVRPGDWNCKSCDFHNYASRDTCYKCHDSK